MHAHATGQCPEKQQSQLAVVALEVVALEVGSSKQIRAQAANQKASDGMLVKAVLAVQVPG